MNERMHERMHACMNAWTKPAGRDDGIKGDHVGSEVVEMDLFVATLLFQEGAIYVIRVRSHQ